MKKYFKVIDNLWKRLIFFIVLLFIYFLLDLSIPFLSSKILDEFVLKNLYFKNVIVLLLLYLIYNFLNFIMSNIYSKYFKDSFLLVHKKSINRLYNLNYSDLTKYSFGKISTIINIDAFNIGEIPDYVTDIIYCWMYILVVMIIFIKTNVAVALFVLISLIFYMFLANRELKIANKHFSLRRKMHDNLNLLLEQTMHGLKEIKTSNIDLFLNNEYEVKRDEWAYEYMKGRKHFLNYTINLKYVIFITKIILYILLYFSFSMKTISIGLIVLLVKYYDEIFINAETIVEKSSDLQEFYISLNRMYDFLFNYENNEIVLSLPYKLSDNVLEFDDVTFSYNGKTILNNLNYSVKKNEVISIIGDNGAGKTTIFNLVFNLVKPDKGSIFINGINTLGLFKEKLCQNVAILNQDAFLIDISIRDYLSLSDSNINKQKQICKELNIHDFIMKLPKKYDTLLKNNGSTFSGGQKKLIQLAKIFLSNNEIILLDEATSSLDKEMTKNVINLIKKNKNKTFIIITHKKEIMEISDRIIDINQYK